MPPYPWLIEDKLDISSTEKKIRVMQSLGVPYPPGYDKQAVADLEKQAADIVKLLNQANIASEPDREIIALIAYLQRLGTDIKGNTE